MKKLITVIVILCLPFLALSQATKQAEPSAITQAENAVTNAKQAAQAAYVNALYVDLKDCGKVTAALAEQKITAQALQFAEMNLASLKKAKPEAGKP